MSEILMGVGSAQGQRFSDFVVDHAGEAMRWECLDQRPSMPFKFVEFETTDAEDKWQPATSPLVAHYSIELWLKLPLAQQKQHSLSSAGILLELDAAESAITVVDDCGQLHAVTPDDRVSISSGGLLIDAILDRLGGLIKDETIIPAGRRTFPADGNVVNN